MVSITLVPDAALPASLTDAQIAATAATLQDWVNTDVAPAWNQGAYAVTAVKRGAAVPAPSAHLWLVHVIPHTAIPGAYGYHHLDAAGNPVLFVALDAMTQADVPLSLAAGHEIAETMCNRLINAWVDNGHGVAYFHEICDPVEFFCYTHKGVLVPNFTLPSFWLAGGTAPFDRMNMVRAPFTPVGNGSEISVATLANQHAIFG